MKKDLIFKVCFMFVLVLSLVAVLGINEVKAAFGEVKNGPISAEILNSLPSTIMLDVKESEFEGQEQIVYEKVVEELAKSGIEVVDNPGINSGIGRVLNVEFEKSVDTNDMLDIRTFVHEDPSEIGKRIRIIYSNSSDYNEADEQAIDTLISKMNLRNEKYIALQDMLGISLDLKTEDFIKNQIKDSTITAYITNGMGGGTDYGFSIMGGFDCMLFKNDVYYKTVRVAESLLSMIEVPANIPETEEAYVEYAKPIITDFLNSYVGAWGTIDSVEIFKADGNDYNVCINNDTENLELIRLVKAEEVEITENVYVENLPVGVSIVASEVVEETKEAMIEDMKINKEVVEVLGSFEFTLVGATELSDDITLIFDLGTDYNGRKVLVSHQKHDGTYEYFERVVEDGKISITVSELSPFIVGLLPEDADESPDTGVNSYIIIAFVLAVVSACGIVVTKKRFN